MKLKMIFKNLNLEKFRDFLNNIIKLSNSGTFGIIMTISNDFLRVIYDVKDINEDYQDFDCQEIIQNSVAYHFFEYDLVINEERDVEQTIDEFTIQSKNPNNGLTLRITLKYLQKLYDTLKKYEDVQLKAENYKNFVSSNDEAKKYKTALVLRGNLMDAEDSLSGLEVIPMKALKKVFDLSQREIGDYYVEIRLSKLLVLQQIQKFASINEKQYIQVQVSTKNDEADILFTSKKLKLRISRSQEKGNLMKMKSNIEQSIIIDVEHLRLICEKLSVLSNLSDYELKNFLRVGGDFFEISCFCSNDSQNKKPYSSIYLSIPAHSVEDGDENFEI